MSSVYTSAPTLSQHTWETCFRSRWAWYGWLLLTIACGPSWCRAGDGLRAGDSVWEVSTRSLPSCGSSFCEPDLQVHRLEHCQWLPADQSSLADELLANPTRTIIYVHGNWMSACEARQRALIVYQLVARRSQEPLRFVLFSWPSEKREHAARDVITKKPIIDSNSHYLASFLNKIPDTQPVGILGYSFGGAVVSGALHLMAGGLLNCQGLCELPLNPIAFRVGLTAPAFDRTDLSAGGKYDRALECIDHMVNLYNSRDPALRRYRFFDRDSSPVAAGFKGLAVTRVTQSLQAHERIQQYDCWAVGRSHSELDYMSCSGFSRSLDNVLGW